MKAMTTYKYENHLFRSWTCFKTQLLQNSARYLLKDIIPTLVMLALVAWGAQLASIKIQQIKQAQATAVVDILQQTAAPEYRWQHSE